MRMLTKLLLILLLCSVCQAAQIIRYVDPDVAVPGDGTSWDTAYASLFAWEAAEQTDLDAANNYMTVYCRSSAGTDDTTGFNISGWTTSVGDYIEIIGADFPSDGVFDDTKYVKAASTDGGNATAITCSTFNVHFINLQIKVTQTSTYSAWGIIFQSIVDTGAGYVDSCIIKGVCSGTGAAKGISINDAGWTAYVSNTVIYDFFIEGDSGFQGISNSIGDVYAYNCTIANCYYGYRREQLYQYGYFYNCAVFNNTDDFSVPTIVDYCASDDGDGTNEQDFTAEATDWNKVFENYAIGDFRLKDYTTPPCCVGVGTDNPGAGLYSDDIAGTARTSTWDIGAFEYTVGAPPAAGGQVIMIKEF